MSIARVGVTTVAVLVFTLPELLGLVAVAVLAVVYVVAMVLVIMEQVG